MGEFSCGLSLSNRYRSLGRPQILRRVDVFTDGSAVNQIPLAQRVGGFGGLILSRNNEQVVRGACLGLTSQQAELMAVIVSLNFLLEKGEKNIQVNIYSDSAYIVNCFKQKWYENWDRINWFNVKNEEYWRVLLSLIFDCGFYLTFNWIKGHSGNSFNERVDLIARKARKDLEECLKKKKII